MNGLSIIYRAYPNISKKPIINFPDKLSMIDFSIKSLKDALKDIDFEFIFISDNCTNQQIEKVENIIKPVASNFLVKKFDGIGNQESFKEQLNCVKNVSYDYILLLEDDYYIGKNDIKINLDLLSNTDIDYSTFYYSYDSSSSTGGMYLKKNYFENCEVTLLPSTTLTFFAKKNILIKDINYFYEFSKGAHDSSIWLKITGNFLWFLPKIFKPLFYKNIKLYFSIIKRYFIYMFKHNRRQRTLAYIGFGDSTHLESDGLFNLFSLKEKINQKYIDFAKR